MNKIPSFTIDHNRLLRGIYVSRVDRLPGGDSVTTYDIRMTEPNRQEALSPRALHAMEHLAATYLRNRDDWKDRVIYWGPMGCCTGNYLLLSGESTPEEILPLIKDTMEFVASFEGEVPGASARDCGNYTFMDLDEARRAARVYVDEVLSFIRPENLTYPT
ncbi:MAG: S-ribosylhomocysteine lyase [Bacteroides sp.]|nr:S-ribosylhomocysteine lyase [Barnesiella sp.]MBD5315012.1 S-ribosylhomocysteine lyase [Bacteroides sp.]MDE6249005.1 S-ribosylhomocysteine lyase [Paramuribaculum sp.]MDE7449912.1 S-ribosylhomocysteine lyase [Paramuribaculum sp.]